MAEGVRCAEGPGLRGGALREQAGAGRSGSCTAATLYRTSGLGSGGVPAPSTPRGFLPAAPSAGVEVRRVGWQDGREKCLFSAR